MQAFIKSPRNLPLLFQLRVALQVRTGQDRTGRLQHQGPQGSGAAQPVPGSPERAAPPGAPAAPSAGSGTRLGLETLRAPEQKPEPLRALRPACDCRQGPTHGLEGEMFHPGSCSALGIQTQPNPKQTKTNPRNFNIIESIISSLVQHSQQAATLQDSLKCTNPEDH